MPRCTLIAPLSGSLPFISSGYTVSMARLRILHLTDTHLFGDASLHYGSVDTEAHLRRALAHVGSRPFDLVVVSGDISEDGTEASYRKAARLIGDWAGARGIRTVFAMGNHDRREVFRAVLGGGQPQAGERELPGEDPARPVASVATQHGWRVIVLDSSVPGRGYGALQDEQLAFLRAEVRTAAEHGTIVVIHHPPVDARTDLLRALALAERDARELLDAVGGTDVRVVLSGHYHLPVVETIGGLPVVVAPGVANVARSFAPHEEESAIDAFGGADIEIDRDRVRVVPFIEDANGGGEVFRFDAGLVTQIAAAAGQPAGSVS